jgi:hypothetical protein
VAIQALPFGVDEDRPVQPFTDGKVEGPYSALPVVRRSVPPFGTGLGSVAVGSGTEAGWGSFR